MDRIDSLGQFKFLIAWGAAAVFILLFPGSTARGDNVPFGPQNVITGGPGLTVGADSVVAIDLDGDGDVDVLSASSEDDKIAWYVNDGLPDPTFTEVVITTSADGAKSVFAADVDSDGDIDVIIASANDDKVAIFVNDGLDPPSFKELVVTAAADGSTSVFAIDIDGDGDIDILSASELGGEITWYENIAETIKASVLEFWSRLR